MLETIIVPAAVLFFLVTWMVAEEATRESINKRRIVPQVNVTLQVIDTAPAPARRSFWFF